MTTDERLAALEAAVAALQNETPDDRAARENAVADARRRAAAVATEGRRLAMLRGRVDEKLATMLAWKAVLDTVLVETDQHLADLAARLSGALTGHERSDVEQQRRQWVILREEVLDNGTVDGPLVQWAREHGHSVPPGCPGLRFTAAKLAQLAEERERVA